MGVPLTGSCRRGESYVADCALWLQEMTAEAEQKLAVLEPAKRELALKRAARLRTVSMRRCGRSSSGR